MIKGYEACDKVYSNRWSDMVDASFSTGVSLEDKAQALRAILESDTFVRSERLKSLLRFLCEAEMEGRGNELTEYLIGTLALGRPKEFAPLEDSSVRSRAHELRQKLEKYYSQEAPFTCVRIDLRKGSYVPRFSVVHLDQETIPVTDSSNAHQLGAVPGVPGPTRHFAWKMGGSFAAGCGAVLAAIVMWSALAGPGFRIPGTQFETTAVPSSWTPELETVWRPFIQKGTPLLITFETRFFVRMGPVVVRDWHVNNMASVEKSEPLMQMQKLFGLPRLAASGNYTDVGAPGALFYLTRALATRAPSLSVKSSSELTAADLRDSNIVLVGKPGGAAQIQRVLAKADLVDVNGKILIKNPKPGERAEYEDQEENGTESNSWSEKYSVITILPGPQVHRRILALTASGSEHPSALAYYLTQPDTVRDLVRHLRDFSGKIPDFYQVLVRAEFKAKALVKVEYVTHRILRTD